ncbi:hypothetical protein [Rhodoferax ferrireducens]|uniref:hypothetical protein n=1 Tax=Rhodoferax ferrireducens TaxID=192843 RepID=UPI003BB5193F
MLRAQARAAKARVRVRRQHRKTWPQHEVLRLKAPGLRPRTWRLFNAARQDDPLYAALPSRKFLPERTRVFLEYLSEQTRIEVNSAMQACQNC